MRSTATFTQASSPVPLVAETAPGVAASGAAVAAGVRLALVGGGSGGHLAPGLALLEQATLAGDGGLGDVVWFTSGRAVEERVLEGLPAALGRVSFERVVLALEPSGGGAPSRTALLLRTAPAVLRARRALVAHRSQALLGLGGFTSLPAALAARSLGIPFVLLEVNAVPGAATRALASLASLVAHAFEASLPGPGRRTRARHRRIGPPLRASFDGRARTAAEVAAARVELGFRHDLPLLVVLGGSQGAEALNRFVREHAPSLVAGGLQVLHQAGPGRLAEAAEPFSGYRALEFVRPVHRALVAATAVLCRGGASTLAEVAACGRPALVVPYPHHPDRHQERNAEQLGEGVRIVPEAALGLASRERIARLCSEAGAEERERMTEALRRAVPCDGAERLWREIRTVVAESNTPSPRSTP